MTSKHTPGPWHYTKNQHAFWIGNQNWNPENGHVKATDHVATVALSHGPAACDGRLSCLRSPMTS